MDNGSAGSQGLLRSSSLCKMKVWSKLWVEVKNHAPQSIDIDAKLSHHNVLARLLRPDKQANDNDYTSIDELHDYVNKHHKIHDVMYKMLPGIKGCISGISMAPYHVNKCTFIL